MERQKSHVDTTWIHTIGKVTGHIMGVSENVSPPLQYSSPNAQSDSKQKETEPCRLRSTPQSNCSVGLSNVKVIKTQDCTEDAWGWKKLRIVPRIAYVQFELVRVTKHYTGKMYTPLSEYLVALTLLVSWCDTFIGVNQNYILVCRKTKKNQLCNFLSKSKETESILFISHETCFCLWSLKCIEEAKAGWW